MALSPGTKANIDRCKSEIDNLKRQIAGYSETIKSRSNNKSPLEMLIG